MYGVAVSLNEFLQLVSDATSFILSFVCSNSPQTPVSEDTTALFGPPLDTAFGEPKNEGNAPSLSLNVFVSVVGFFDTIFVIYSNTLKKRLS